jgi:hypothetical protein
MMQLHTSTPQVRPLTPAEFDPRCRQQPKPARRCVSFAIGQVVVTPGAHAALDRSGEAHARFLERHATGDWRETPADEVDENCEAIAHGRGVFTQHRLRNGAAVWIATREDRSRTVVFTPDEI